MLYFDFFSINQHSINQSFNMEKFEYKWCIQISPWIPINKPIKFQLKIKASFLQITIMSVTTTNMTLMLQ